ncbi:uncharacterized protein [Dermacentor albipictus]|uniref:uncharacterized protein n=1 Tax=Dermacentor albipictus TaxID=60249 RepID=UPI0038FCB298
MKGDVAAANGKMRDVFAANETGVRVVMAGSESPVLYYRKEGDPSRSEGNFELALMTSPLGDLLCKLGIEKLCINSTHGTNRYKFQLTTLLTTSEDGSGIPCAYLISERVNTETMVRFFEATKEKVGVIECKAFMSDAAPVYATQGKWAYCYRKQVGLTTNNHIESTHKILKELEKSVVDCATDQDASNGPWGE